MSARRNQSPNRGHHLRREHMLFGTRTAIPRRERTPPRSAPTSQVRPWLRCCTTTSPQSNQATFTGDSVSKRENTCFFQRTGSENIDTEKNFLSLFNAINTLAAKYDLPILYSCHPRSRKRIEQSGFVLDKRIIRHEPLGFHDYNCLQMNAAAIISDSGTLPEESSFFTSIGHPFPAICIRTSTERPEALDKGRLYPGRYRFPLPAASRRDRDGHGSKTETSESPSLTTPTETSPRKSSRLFSPTPRW